KVKVLGDVIEV
nr:Chain A, Alpha-crystallin B chain [Homo sapiens]